MELDPLELGSQLLKPSGEIGKQIGEVMNQGNSNLHSLVFSMTEIPSKGSVLEIGFGNGKYLQEYFRINPETNLTGIDFSDVMCDEARSLNADLIAGGKIGIINENFIDYSFADESFDIAVSINNVYFWRPIEDYIKKLHRILKPGGSVLIGLRPRSMMINLAFVARDFILYEQNELEELFSGHGFAVDKNKSENIRRTSADGTVVDTVDICIRFKKV
jgi:SAM-dependent methyltransferase